MDSEVSELDSEDRKILGTEDDYDLEQLHARQLNKLQLSKTHEESNASPIAREQEDVLEPKPLKMRLAAAEKLGLLQIKSLLDSEEFDKTMQEDLKQFTDMHFIIGDSELFFEININIAIATIQPTKKKICCSPVNQFIFYSFNL